jgi:hypothetical protein
MRIQIEGIIAGTYAAAILASAAQALPRAGKGGGLEYLIIGFLSMPSTLLCSWLFDFLPLRFGSWLHRNVDKLFLLSLTVAGLLQALLLYLVVHWLRTR